jgi:hypothetical protein
MLRQPKGHSAARRVRSIEKSNDLIGTCDLPACSIVLQPTTLLLTTEICFQQRSRQQLFFKLDILGGNWLNTLIAEYVIPLWMGAPTSETDSVPLPRLANRLYMEAPETNQYLPSWHRRFPQCYLWRVLPSFCIVILCILCTLVIVFPVFWRDVLSPSSESKSKSSKQNRKVASIFLVWFVGLLFDHEDGSRTFLQDVKKHPPNYMASHPRKEYSFNTYCRSEILTVNEIWIITCKVSLWKRSTLCPQCIHDNTTLHTGKQRILNLSQ